MKNNGDDDNYFCSISFETRFSNFLKKADFKETDSCIQSCISTHFKNTRTREADAIWLLKCIPNGYTNQLNYENCKCLQQIT